MSLRFYPLNKYCMATLGMKSKITLSKLLTLISVPNITVRCGHILPKQTFT